MLTDAEICHRYVELSQIKFQFWIKVVSLRTLVILLIFDQIWFGEFNYYLFNLF